MFSKLGIPVWLFILIAVLMALNIQGYLLFDHDEGAFSEATRGMFERGDFITTWLNDRVRFDKPILIYWLQGASMSLFGTEVWAFRLPSVLSGIGWCLAIFAFARIHISNQGAIAAALIAALSFGVSAISHVATADALLNALLCGTLLTMYHYWNKPSNRLLLLVYALMGLGVLTKGPVAVAIPGAVAAIHYTWSGQLSLFLKAIFYFPGWALFLAIAAPWYVLEYLAQGQAFIDGFILKHNVNRFNNAMEGHSGGLFFYPVVLPFLLAPFGALLIRMLPSVRTLLNRHPQTADPLNRFLWIWFLVVLLLFTVASTKLPHYILYGCTPLILLMARYRHWLKNRWFAALFPLLFFGLMTALPLSIPSIKAGLTNPIEIATADRAADYLDTSFAILAACAGVLSLLIVLIFKTPVWSRLAIVGVIQALFVWFILVPAISEAQQRPVYEAAQFVRALDQPVVTQSIDMPSFNVYLNKVTPRRSLEPGEIGFGREDRLDLDDFQLLFQSGPIVIVRRPTDEERTAEIRAQKLKASAPKPVLLKDSGMGRPSSPDQADLSDQTEQPDQSSQPNQANQREEPQ